MIKKCQSACCAPKATGYTSAILSLVLAAQAIKRMANKQVLIINGSVRGKKGNSWKLAKIAAQLLKAQGVKPIILNLSEPKPAIKQVYDLLDASDALLIVSGTYWSNWGSPLQRFIEVITAFENSPALLGKPVAAAVTMDSVGGAEVAARIQAVFSGLGCWQPPCSTLVLSRIAQEAIAASAGSKDDPNEDVWRTDDISIVLKNLVAATAVDKSIWTSWPHIRSKIPGGEWPETGDLDFRTPKFI